MMERKVDFFQRNMSNGRSFSARRRKSNVWIWILLVIFLFGIGGAIFWKFFIAPVDLTKVNSDDLVFSLGEEIYLEGEIKADGDIITHTHTINDSNYGVIGIKSSSINLSDYAGFVQLTGIVEKLYQGSPIVKVIALSGMLNESAEMDTDIVLDENSGVYILGAGIQFLPSFFDEYVLLNEGENGEIHIQNVETEKEIILNYFRCNASDPSKNCKGLTDDLLSNNAQSFVTSEGDTYYKNSGSQSWFVANGDWWGVFIENVSDDDVYELKDLIKFANQKNMNEWIKSRAMKICQGSGEKLQKIDNSEINLKQEGLIVTVSGDGMEKQMTCQILVDFSLPSKGELQSLTIGNDVVFSEEPDEVKEEAKTEEIIQEEEKKEEGQISATSLDTNVPQFPIKEEGLVYKSARGGYTLKFPSSNISYSVSSVKENFGRSDVNCSYVINVIKYSEKENLEISPAVRVYECDGSVDQSWAQGIVVYPRLDKKFIVQMNDGSWNDFSMNLKFEELVPEE